MQQQSETSETTTESTCTPGLTSLPGLSLDEAMGLTPAILLVFVTAYIFKMLVRFLNTTDIGD